MSKGSVLHQFDSIYIDARRCYETKSSDAIVTA